MDIIMVIIQCMRVAAVLMEEDPLLMDTVDQCTMKMTIL